MSSELRCLAIQQPWAWAVATGAKDIENRSWSTTYRGPVVIQASASKTAVAQTAKQHGLPARSFAYGALIGVADLLDVTPLNEDLEANPWAWGPYCWRFGNARLFREPIAAKGKLNLYTLAPDLATKAVDAISVAHVTPRDDVDELWLAKSSATGSSERELGHLESYIDLGDGENALRLALRRVQRERTADTLIELGRAQFVAAEQTASALNTLNAAVELDATSARAYFVRSLIHDSLAASDREKAVELDPSFDVDESDAATDDEGA